MNVHLTPEQEAFVQQAIASGDYHSAEDAVHEALAHWQERRRAIFELRTAIDESDEDFAAGLYTEYSNPTLPQLAEELKREARNLRDVR